MNGQSLQKSLNRVWLKVVQHVVCVIETWPSPSWIARVSMPSLAGACTFAIQDARHHLCGHAICASALGDERAEAVQHAHHLHRGPLAIAARRGSTIHDRQVSLTSASGCATIVANVIPLMMTDQAVSQ